MSEGVLEMSSVDESGCVVCKYYKIEMTLIDGCIAWRHISKYPTSYFVNTFKHMNPEWDGVPDAFGDDTGDVEMAADVFLDLTLWEHSQLIWVQEDGWNIRKSRINTEE
jgi:hypothetical protein